jgi:hypothetical protein
MKEHKFKTWFPEAKHMTEPWTIEDVARGYYNQSLIPDLDKGVLIADPYSKNKNYIKRQYTGRKDRHGVEIYDGDEVVYKDENGKMVEGFIVWATCMCGYAITSRGVEDKRLSEVPRNTMTVIGNIYENPELVDECLKEPEREH